MGKQILYHGTSMKNVESIKEGGLEHRFEGVYLTDSIESAQKWTGFKLKLQGELEVAIIEVEVDESNLSEGMDHSPMMVQIFGVGKSILHDGNIPASKIIECHLFKMAGEK